jgi:predicted Zn-dependent protease
VAIRPGSSLNQVVASFLKSTGASVQQERSLTTGGMPTRQLLSVLSNGQQRAVIVSHFYQKGQDVFAFHGMASAADYVALSEVLQLPATGFSALTDRTLLNRQPKRIAVTTLAKSSTLEKTLLAMRIDRELWTTIAWLNGLQLGEVLNAGEQIKVIR